MKDLIFLAMIMVVDVLSLKIHSFLDIHNFHQKIFGIVCQSLDHAAFLTFTSGIRFYKEVKSETTEMLEGANAINPLSTNFHTSWEKSQPMKMCSKVSTIDLQKQQWNGPRKPRLDKFSPVNTLLCMSDQVKKFTFGRLWEDQTAFQRAGDKARSNKRLQSRIALESWVISRTAPPPFILGRDVN